MDLERRVELLEGAMKGLLKHVGELQESQENLDLRNQAIAEQLKIRDFGQTLMRHHLERQ